MNWLNFRFLKFFDEGAAQVTVARYSCDLRLIYLHNRGILSLELIHTYIAVAEVFLCPFHNVSLCKTTQPVKFANLLRPRYAVNVAVNHLTDTTTVVVKGIEF